MSSWHRVSGGIFLAMLLACAGPTATGTSAPTRDPILPPTAQPAPTSELAVDVLAPTILEPTPTPPWPTKTQSPTAEAATPFPAPVSDPPDAIFRGGLARTGFYDDEGVASFNRLKWKFVAEGADVPPALRRYALYALAGIQSSPAISDGIVFVGSDDFYLYAVDLETGKKRWRFLAKPSENLVPGPVQSSPAVAHGTVFFGTMANHLYALDKETGEEKWKFKAGSAVLSSPAISGGTVYFGSWDNSVYAVDAETGTELWRFQTGDKVWSSPATGGGALYIGSDDRHLYSIDMATGDEIWRFKTGNVVSSTPALSDGVVYFGSFDANIYAVDAATGRRDGGFQQGVPFTLPRRSQTVCYTQGAMMGTCMPWTSPPDNSSGGLQPGIR